MEIVVPDEFRYLYEESPSRPILKVPNTVLRQKAAPISKLTKKVQFLADDMVRLMRKANGIGLAAPQVGVLQRLIVIAPLDMRPVILLNPEIVEAEGEQIGTEGCLSIPGLYGEVKRSEFVRVEALDRKGREIEIELEGLPARVVQHEIDHLEGILFTDKVDFATLHWEHPGSEAAKAE